MNNADIRALDRLIADIQFSCWHGSAVDWEGRPAPKVTKRGIRRTKAVLVGAGSR